MTAQRACGSGKQLLGAERLGQEVTGAEGGGLLAIGGLSLAGEHDDRGVTAVRNLAQPGEHFEAVHVGHHDVEQDQIHGVVGTKTLQCRLAILADVDGIGRLLQLELDDATNIGLIVDYENVSTVLGEGGHSAALGWRLGWTAAKGSRDRVPDSCPAGRPGWRQAGRSESGSVRDGSFRRVCLP
jgi:hypothetical protein